MEFICNYCPRKCGVLRNEISPSGVCGAYSLPTVMRAAPHYGEEPCLTGVRGSGAVFFSGCSLKCVYCQNREISFSSDGRKVDYLELRDIFYRLRDQGVHNINLVTASHFTPVVAKALDGADLGIPVVWNSSGYECVDTLKMLEGLVQIYLPDFKYTDKKLAEKYSHAADYPEYAEKAIAEMYRQRGSYRINSEGIMESGVMIRHLVLPGNIENSLGVIDYVADNYRPGDVLFSLMSQYTPMPGCEYDNNLCRTINDEEYDSVVHYLHLRGLEDGFLQGKDAATNEMIPAFDLSGVF